MKKVFKIPLYATIVFFICFALMLLSEFWKVIILKETESYPWESNEATWYYKNLETYALVNFITGILLLLLATLTVIKLRQNGKFEIWYLSCFVLIIAIVVGLV